MRIDFDFDLPGTCEIVDVSLFLNNLLGDNYHQPPIPVQSSLVRPSLAIISFPSVPSGPDISFCAGLCLSPRTSHTSPLSIVRYSLSRHIFLDPLSAPPSLPNKSYSYPSNQKGAGEGNSLSPVANNVYSISSIRPFLSSHNQVIM